MYAIYQQPSRGQEVWLAKNRQLMGLHVRKKTMSSFMAACLSFQITHKGAQHSVCGVGSLHASDGITRFIHRRSHTYRSNKDEGRQAVRAGAIPCSSAYMCWF